MMRPDIMFNIAMWIANSVAWAYNGHAGMMVLSMFGVLGSVMLGRLYSD
jgi:hypothetical protein